MAAITSFLSAGTDVVRPRDSTWHVVVMEDDQVYRTVLVAALRSAGLEVALAEDTSDVVRYAHSGWSVFVFDIKVHEVADEGLRALDWVKHECPSSICVILTNSKDQRDIRQATKLGVDRYVIKSGSKEQIVVVADSIMYQIIERSWTVGFEASREPIERKMRAIARKRSMVRYQGPDYAEPTRAPEEIGDARTLESERNIVTYQALLRDDNWYGAHAGMVAGLVDGKCIVVDKKEDEVLRILRDKFPENSYFIVRVDRDEDEDVELPGIDEIQA